MLKIDGRAHSRRAKRALVDRIYTAWCAVPDQRLGQLVVNAAVTNPYDIEDAALARAAEAFAAKAHGRIHG